MKVDQVERTAGCKIGVLDHKLLYKVVYKKAVLDCSKS